MKVLCKENDNMIYYGSRISDNLSTSPEGFLICHNVPIARTGYQDYLGKEFPEGMQEEYDINPNKVYKVYRSENEVFSPATIASFEGKPFTDDHPPEMVNTQNIGMYGKGHIQNIRKGDGEYKNMLIADVIANDEATINAIRNKTKREVSCGYDYVIQKGQKGFEQTQIRGNHLALVDNARAGEKAAIQDSQPDAIKQKKEGEQKKMKGNIFYKMFAAFAKDADPEEIEQAGKALSEIGKDVEPAAPAGASGGIEKDVADLKAGMAEVTKTLQQLVQSDKQVHAEIPDEDKLSNLEKNFEETSMDADPEDAPAEEKEHAALNNLIEAEKEEGADSGIEKEDKPEAMDAALKQVIKVMKPKLLAIEDKAARTIAVDSFCAAIVDARKTKKPAKNDYAALLKAVKANSKATDNKPKTMDSIRSEQVNAINKYNPHLKKEEK